MSYTASDLLSVDEAAAYHGVDPRTIRRAIRLGQLAAVRKSRFYLVRFDVLTRWNRSPAGRPSSRQATA